MAGALGFEPRNFLIQSQAPYQLGHAPAGARKATTVYQHTARSEPSGRDSIFNQPPPICARSRVAVNPDGPELIRYPVAQNRLHTVRPGMLANMQHCDCE